MFLIERTAPVATVLIVVPVLLVISSHFTSFTSEIEVELTMSILHTKKNCQLRSKLFTSALLTALLLMTGCGHLGNYFHNGFKVGPDYARPAAPIADEWIDFNDPRVISEQLGVDERTWWALFGDANINELVEQTYDQNLTLRVAGLRVLESQAERAIAVGQLFPQFQEGFAEYARTQISRNAGAIIPPPPTAGRTFTNWTTGFNAAWELDLWGRYRRGIEAADATLDATVEDYDDILVSLIAESTSAYLEIRGFQERLAFAEANIQTQQKSLELATTRFEGGDVGKLDVTQAQTSLEQTRALVPVLQAGMRQANNRLCTLIGIPPQDLITERLGNEKIPETPESAIVGIPAELLRRRPDVRRAEREVAAQSAVIGIATADLFPAFTINGSINWQASKFGDVFRSSSNGGFLGPTFNWNLLNYGRLVNNIRAEDARFQQLAVLYQQTVLEANREVEDAIIRFLKSQEEEEALARSVAAASESVSLAEIQYRLGAIDFDRVNNLQRDLTLLQDSLAVARTNVALSLVGVYRALGGGWEIRMGATPMAADLPVPEEPIPAGDDVPPQPPQPFPEDLPAQPNPNI